MKDEELSEALVLLAHKIRVARKCLATLPADRALTSEELVCLDSVHLAARLLLKELEAQELKAAAF